MADAITAMGDKPAKQPAKKEGEDTKKAIEKALIELPKPKEKKTLPDGTVIESY